MAYTCPYCKGTTYALWSEIEDGVKRMDVDYERAHNTHCLGYQTARAEKAEFEIDALRTKLAAVHEENTRLQSVLEFFNDKIASKKTKTKDIVVLLEKEALSVDEQWARLKKYAPEVLRFWNDTQKANGKYHDWWEDKAHQMLCRLVLYCGKLKADLNAANAEIAQLQKQIPRVEMRDTCIHWHYSECGRNYHSCLPGCREYEKKDE